jgi:hypothetical protein
MVQMMNTIAKEENVADQLPEIHVGPESDEAASQQSTAEESNVEIDAEQEDKNKSGETTPIELVAVSKEPEIDDKEELSQDEALEEPRTMRTGRNILKPACYMAVTKVDSRQWKEEATNTAIKLELTMLFKDFKVLRVIWKAQILGGKVLKSQLFVVTKYFANGIFDKMKAGLVTMAEIKMQKCINNLGCFCSNTDDWRGCLYEDRPKDHEVCGRTVSKVSRDGRTQ